MIQRLLLAAVLAAALSGCGGSSSMPVEAPGTLPAVEPIADYRLGVADRVRVKVFNEDTLSDEFAVNTNGAVSFPPIGDVVAVGRTTSEVRDEIQRRLADGYLRNPRVSIDVLSFRPYYILGEVNKPGAFPYSIGLTAEKAVATAGGYTYRAKRKHVLIRHDGDTVERVAVPWIALRPGDTVRVGERHF